MSKKGGFMTGSLHVKQIGHNLILYYLNHQNNFMRKYLPKNNQEKAQYMMKSCLVLLFVIQFSIVGCFAPKPIADSKQTFIFEYAPKETNKSGSATMVLGMVRPYYAAAFTSSSGELFKSFRNALANDIEELIIAKGFSIKGPYISHDEMIFEDKKRTDVLIQIEIDPRFTAHAGGWKSHFTLTTANRTLYSYSGTVSLVGKINISGVEPLTNEKIWAKSVAIPNVENIQINTSNKYERTLNDLELLNDPGVYNAVGKALMTQYAGIMDKITAHFNVEEFNGLKSQIKELKSKKGY